MEHGDLLIKIQLDDYVLPSQLHGSTICVGLSWTHSTSKALEERKDDFAEQCFDEVPDFSFQAFGLSPGTQYTLRISLYGKSCIFSYVYSIARISPYPSCVLI